MKIDKQLCLKRLASPASTYADAKSLPIIICCRILSTAVTLLP
jgi:hypothetical protein